MQHAFQTRSAAKCIQASRFSQEIEQLLGDDLDLDPLFFQDSWTIGKSAALNNLRRRRDLQKESQSQLRAALELQHLTHAVTDQVALIDSTGGISVTSGSARAAAEYPNRMSSESWTPQDWVPFDRIRQSWIPAGWLPEEPRRPPNRRDQDSSQPSGPLVEAPEQGMSVSRAAEILGVSPGSTALQIRSEYRRKVGEWHPDRLHTSCEAERRRATEQMAELNQAYRLLCDAMRQAA